MIACLQYSLPADWTREWSGRVPIEIVTVNPEQPRTRFDKTLLELAAESLEEMQIQPVLVIPYRDPKRPLIRLMIVDGERRFRGLTMLNRTDIAVCFQPGITLANIHEKSFAANFCREGHTHADTARAIDRQYNAGKTFEQIARLVGKTPAWASNEHKLLKLAPELLELVDSTDKAKRMAVRIGVALSGMPHAKQRIQWERVKGLKAAAQFTKIRFSGGCSPHS